MSINHSFAGKTVLITGGASGIGRELVQKFHDGGATVLTVDKNSDLIQKLRNELPSVRSEILDLVDWEGTKRLIESFGPIDHLVNNAGIAPEQKFMDITKETANLLFDVNFKAVICVTQAVAKGLIDAGREGSVVNIGSFTARDGSPMGYVVYAALKAGLENLTKSMALELGAHGIRVNCVLPGVVETPLLESLVASSPALEDWIKNSVLKQMVVKRLVKPGDIADAIIYLLSPLSGMIVGESILVDGGLLLRR